MNKVSKIIILIIVIVLCFLGIFLVTKKDDKYMSYKEFVQNVENKLVDTATITEDRVEFSLKNDEQEYYTDNPENDGFKEFLLLNEIKIEDSFGSSDVLYIFDILFYLIFIAAVCFGIYKLVNFTNNGFKIVKNSNTKFSDIAGMEEIKKDMMQIVDVLKNQKEYKANGIRLPKGIIFEGPPGNGKTLFAKALATEAGVNFIPTKGADFQSAMMSVGPMKIKNLFRIARKHKPCIIFIDEFDGIGERRNYAGTGVDKENNRLIISMLNEMDGFSSGEGILVIAATNSYASLDAALVRPGRFDRKYKIDNPDKDTIIKVIEMYTKNKKLDEKINIEELSKCFSKLSIAAIETIINEAALIAKTENREKITINDIAKAGKKTNTINLKIT